MAKILRMSDRIVFKIDDLKFKIAPLSNDRKNEIAACMKYQGGEQVYDLLKAQHLYMKYGLKDVEGIETYDGKKYKLEFEGDHLTDECVSEIFYLEQKGKLLTAAWQVLNGITDQLSDPMTGEKLDGVELEVESTAKK